MKDHTAQAVNDIRKSVENEKMKTLKEFSWVDKKIGVIESTIEWLPGKVNECESLCKNFEQTLNRIKKS